MMRGSSQLCEIQGLPSGILPASSSYSLLWSALNIILRKHSPRCPDARFFREEAVSVYFVREIFGNLAVSVTVC